MAVRSHPPATFRRRASAIGPAIAAAVLLSLAACNGTSDSPSARPRTTTSPAGTAATTTTAPTTTVAAPAGTAAPTSFTGTVAAVTAGELGASYHDGCPVAPADLRTLHITYWGFDDQPHTGTMVVAASVVDDVLAVFHRLYDERFPIRQMKTLDAFDGSDDASMAADNTSGFNCRYAVAAGPPQWSAHAFGTAIDVNTVENPYLEGGELRPPAGDAFADRSSYRPGMAVPDGQLVQAFAAVGWQWGGRWAGTPDYQHFSRDGN